MNNPIRRKSKHIVIPNLLPLIILIISLSLSTVVSSSYPPSILHKTQRFTSVVDTLNQTISKVNLSFSNFSDLRNLTHRDHSAFEDCLELLEDTVFDLTTAILELRTPSPDHHNVKMLLSAAMTNTRTCLDGFASNDDEDENSNSEKTYGVAESLKESLFNISSYVRNSLAMLDENIPRKMENDVGFPTWVDHKLLQTPVDEIEYNLVVDQNGTGNFTTIKEAVSAAPNASETRFTIYIKGGEYSENVEIPKKKTMIMFVGDGIGKTIIKANRNTVDGWETFHTATVAVSGNDFVAKGISFVNFAGPSKEQAVALRSSSNQSAFYQCAFEGYQDTLYVHSATQFYRECDIFGTVDFICGNAAVVFQKCNLYARKPNPKQTIVITAQSREKSDDATGISMIDCRVLAAADLIPVKANFKAYLGRPWKLYSRTVFIKSFIDDLIDPAGWLEWDKEFALETLYYGEYLNEGPGANTTGRVKWPGYKSINASEATQFTVGPFTKGTTWLKATNVPFSLGF